MNRALTLVISVWLILLICFSAFSIVGAITVTKNFFLPQEQGVIHTINLQVGQQVTGNFKIVGERIHTWEYFYFKILDPKGVTFKDEECIYTDPTYYNFTFTAYTAGAHTLAFENSGQNDRYVDLTYTVDSETLPDASTPTPTNSPEPTPTVPEFPHFTAIPILLSTLAVAMAYRIKKSKTNTS